MLESAATGAAAGSSLGPWGAVAGGALGAISSAFGSKKSSKTAKKIAAMQLAWEKQKAQNSIQWSVQDAIKAGINPAVAVNTGNMAGSINPPMPNTEGYTSAGQQLSQGIAQGIELMQSQKKVDSEATKNYADALNAEVEAGLKPRETAVKEMQAETDRRRQAQEAQESLARIQRIMTLLPGESMEQKQMNMQRAMDIAVQQAETPGKIAAEKANNEILELTGGFISLDDMKKLVAGIAGGGVYHYEQKQNRTSAEKNARRDYRVQNYNSRGKLTGETYYQYRD